MAPKRHLGLGKAAKSKKQKKSDTPEQSKQEEERAQSNEITVELSDEVDANDELAQLRALWKTYAKSEKENELVLNGIVHECDRLLRKSKSEEGDKQPLPDFFHSIYALALADLATFHAEDNKKVNEYFDAALERVGLGLESNTESIDLLFTHSRILINRIPLQYVSQMDVDSKVNEKFPKIDTLLDKALSIYEKAELKADSLKQYGLFNEENLEILEAVDDLLDIIDNFGKDKLEGDESDQEDDEEQIELSKKHPLYEISSTDKYNQWWRDHIIKFLENVNKELEHLKIDYKDTKNSENPLLPLHREICKRIGQSYLQEAEIPSSVFTTLTYDEGFREVKELEGLTREQSQVIAQDLFKTALSYFEMAEDKEEPGSWVNVAEAIISLANMYEVDGEEQEKLYLKAEKILTKANNATHGKYEDVLENLLQH